MTRTEQVIAAYILLLLAGLTVLHLRNPRAPRPSPVPRRVPPGRPRLEHSEGWTTDTPGEAW